MSEVKVNITNEMVLAVVIAIAGTVLYFKAIITFEQYLVILGIAGSYIGGTIYGVKKATAKFESLK